MMDGSSVLRKGEGRISLVSDLKQLIAEKGCYSREENLRIYEKYFAKAPRYLFRAVNKKYNIVGKTLCDVGCSYGMNLIFSAPGSYGIEIDAEKTRFARSIVLEVHQRDLLQDGAYGLPKIDVVWCSAVLEHLDAPYPFIRRLMELLKPGGLMIIYVPTIPLIRWLEHLPGVGRFLTGYDNRDHRYAFVPETLRFLCERAGLRTIEVSPFLPIPFSVFNHMPVLNRLVGRCVYIGQYR